MSVDASVRAQSWAYQRQQAIEKAKQLREERKMNLAKAGEMSVAREGNFGRITSSENQQRDFQKPLMNDFYTKKPATMKYGLSPFDPQVLKEDSLKEKNNLMLLKPKMRDQGGYQDTNWYAGKDVDKSRNYYDNDPNQYAEYNNTGARGMGQDRRYNDVYQNEQPNYRKVFKPNLGREQEYQPVNSNVGHDYNQYNGVASKRANTLERSNQYNPTYPEYQPQSYARQRGDFGGTPIGGVDKYGYAKDPYNQPSYDDYPDFSKGISSRLPKANYGATKGRNAQAPNIYDEEYDPQYMGNQPKYSGYKSPMVDRNQNPMNYYDKPSYEKSYEKPSYEKASYEKASYEKPQQRNMAANLPQRNNQYEANVPQYNKEWQQNKNNDFDERDDYQPKNFAKPPINKKPQQPMQAQNKRRLNPNSIDDIPIKASNNNALPSEAYEDDDGPVEECPHGCGRSFKPKALTKHANVCLTVFQSKRKKFETAKQRLTEELAQIENENRYNAKRAQKKQTTNNRAGKQGGGSKKWKQQSEAFRAALRVARGHKLSKEEEVNLASAQQDSLVQCHCCGRRFNEHAAARHIPFCESKQKTEMHRRGGEAKMRRY